MVDQKPVEAACNIVEVADALREELASQDPSAPDFLALAIVAKRALSGRDLIEEAARVCEGLIKNYQPDGWAHAALESAAHHIRALRTSPAPSPPDDTTRLREALQKAASQFRFYEREHREKAMAAEQYDPAEADARAAKYRVNQEFAEMCEAALSSPPPSPWRPIESAPKNRTMLLLVGGVYHGLPFPGYWEESAFNPEEPWVCAIGGHRLYAHSVRWWQPLPLPAPPKGGE